MSDEIYVQELNHIARTLGIVGQIKDDFGTDKIVSEIKDLETKVRIYERFIFSVSEAINSTNLWYRVTYVEKALNNAIDELFGAGLISEQKADNLREGDV